MFKKVVINQALGALCKIIFLDCSEKVYYFHILKFLFHLLQFKKL